MVFRFTSVVPVLVLAILLLSIGCSRKPAAESMLTDYQRRVAGLAGFEVQASDLVPLIPWPSKRERVLDVPQQRASMAEWFRLRDCRLFSLINERNSILGRVQQPSQRLVYEVKFIALARECLVQLGGAENSSALTSTRTKLEATLADKERALYAVLWNSMMGSDDFVALVRVAAAPLSPGDDVEASAAASALTQWLTVQRLALSGAELSSGEYEAANKVLAQSQWLGRLYRGQQLAIQTLQATAALLERRLEKPLCYSRKPNRKGRAFRSVFQRYYASGVQPYLAQLKNQQRQAAGLLSSLFEPFDKKPAAVERWNNYYQVRLQQKFDSALSRHTKAWQALLGQCGLMPGTEEYNNPGDAAATLEGSNELAPKIP